jgi:hypothetical protein
MSVQMNTLCVMVSICTVNVQISLFLLVYKCSRFVSRCVILCNFNCRIVERNYCKIVTNFISGGGGRNSYGGYQDQGPPEEVSRVYINTVIFRQRGSC